MRGGLRFVSIYIVTRNRQLLTDRAFHGTRIIPYTQWGCAYRSRISWYPHHTPYRMCWAYRSRISWHPHHTPYRMWLSLLIMHSGAPAPCSIPTTSQRVREKSRDTRTRQLNTAYKGKHSCGVLWSTTINVQSFIRNSAQKNRRKRDSEDDQRSSEACVVVLLLFRSIYENFTWT